MARTYINSPYVIPEIFRQIVAKVSVNLSTDGDLSIPQVSYKFGTWIEVMDQLIADDKDPNIKAIKYPLIVLLQPYEATYQNARVAAFRGDIVIVTNTEPTMKIARRYTEKFEPILFPIYAELHRVIADSRFFLGYNTAFPHKMVELPHMGSASNDGNTAYRLPDFLDGVMLQGVELKINTPLCMATCLPKHAIEVLSVIKTVASSGIGTDTLSVTATAENSDITATYTWSIENQDGSGVQSLGSFNMAGTNTANLDTLNIADGLHVVTITASNGAQAQIEVGVNVGYEEGETIPATPVITVLSYVNESEAFDYSIGCGLTPVNTYAYGPLVGTNEASMLRITQVENGVQVYDEVLDEPELGHELDRALIYPTTEVETIVNTAYESTLRQKIKITLKPN